MIRRNAYLGREEHLTKVLVLSVCLLIEMLLTAPLLKADSIVAPVVAYGDLTLSEAGFDLSEEDFGEGIVDEPHDRDFELDAIDLAIDFEAADDCFTLKDGECRPPRLQDFGFGSMRVRGKAALGERPVVIIMINSSEPDRPGHTAATALGLERKVFDVTGGAIGYFRHASERRFSWTNGGMYGPFEGSESATCWETKEHTAKAGRSALRHEAVRAMLRDPGFDGRLYDVDRNSVLDPSELAVYISFSCPTRYDDEGKRRGSPGGGSARKIDVIEHGFRYEGYVASTKESPPAVTIFHELAHLLGARDLYGKARQCDCDGQTLMGVTGNKSIELDAAHRFALGWLEPEMVDLRAMDYKIVESLRDTRSATLFYDTAISAYQNREFFLVEDRRKQSPFDIGLRNEGLVFWRMHTKVSGALRAVQAARVDVPNADGFYPSTEKRAWTEVEGVFSPRWSDGSRAGFSAKTEIFTILNWANHTEYFGPAMVDASFPISLDVTLHLRRGKALYYSDSLGRLLPPSPRPYPWTLSGLERRPTAAIGHGPNRVWLFDEDRVHLLDVAGRRVIGDVPLSLTPYARLPHGIDAAVQHPDGSQHFFMGPNFWRFDPIKNRMSGPMRIGIDGWSGLPADLDSAFRKPGGRAIFFRGEEAYEYDFRRETVDRLSTRDTSDWLSR